MTHANAQPVTPGVIDYFVEQLAEAFSRIQYDVQLLHRRENDWEQDPDDGMYVFKGFLPPFVVKKHVVDALREAWHIYDGTRELLNAKWQAGHVKVTDTDVDNGKGPGRAIVNKHVKSSQWIQLCGDLANVTKHYKLAHATKTGNGPPQLGDTMLAFRASGKVEYSTNPDGARKIKVEKPASIRPTMVVLDERGNRIGDAVEIVLRARDSWLDLLGRCGVTFEPSNRAAVG